MAELEDSGRESDVAVAERPEAPPAASGADKPTKPAKRDKRNKKSKQDDDLEYEVEFKTPFGKVEFEFEPTSAKERKDQKKREAAAKDAAKAAAKDAAKAAKKLEKQSKKQAKRGETVADAAQKGGSMLPILLVAAIVIAAVAVAIWLFARPGDEAEDAIPPEFRDEPVPATEPQAFVDRARRRIREAVHAGKKASREAQREQQQKFEDLTETR